MKIRIKDVLLGLIVYFAVSEVESMLGLKKFKLVIPIIIIALLGSFYKSRKRIKS